MNLDSHVAIYRRLLRILPDPFKSRYRAQMVAAFREDLIRSRAYRPGRSTSLRVWITTLSDLAVTAASEWGPQLRRQRRSGWYNRGGKMFSGSIRDIRYGIRSLRRAKGFTTLAILIVALGVGANATIFSLSRTLLWESAPLVSEPSSLVRISRANANTQSGALTYPDYEHYRDANTVFDGLMAYEEDGFAVSMSLGEAIETVHLGNVSDNYFDVLGVPMALGREFLPEEDRRPGSGAVAVISHALWTRSYGADPNVVGRTVILNGHAFTVIGVAPRDFRGVSPIEANPDVWAPLNMYATLRNTGTGMLERVEGEIWRWLSMVGRLKDGVTIDMATANMEGLASYLQENFAEWSQNQSVYLTHHIGYRPSSHSSAVTILRMLMSVVALVMIVASANIAMILLARASTREQEIAIRLAIGANRWRLIRQLLVESAILGFTGSIVGFFVSFWAVGPVSALLPAAIMRPVTPDIAVFAFAMALGVLIVTVFGTIPALRATRTRTGARVTAPHDRSVGRLVLVVGQVAVSVIIAAGAILFTRSLNNARAVDLGFETQNRLVVSFNLQRHGYERDAVPQFLNDALNRVHALPGVEDVTSTRMVPFQGSWGSSFSVPGVTPPDGDNFDSGFNAVGPNYFDVMRVQLISGRGFGARDVANSDPVVVVNQELARQVWGTENVVGRVISWRDKSWTVIGVARDGTYYNLGEDAQPQVFTPVLQEPQAGIALLIATTDNPIQAARSISNAIREIDPNIAITGTRTVKEIFDEEIGRYRVAATMVGIFGMVGVILAAVGMYGVLSFIVAQRTREIGLRMALGASARRVARDVVNRGVRVAAIGIVIGLLASVAGARLATSFLFGIEARDPLTFIGASLILAAVAALASAIPARRAARVDPMQSLKSEI